MKPSKNQQPITKTTAQPHNPNGRPTTEPKFSQLDVQDLPASFYIALGRLLQTVCDRGTKGCLAHTDAFRQAADLLLHPEALAKDGVLLEVINHSMTFQLDLNHHGETFHLQLADYHAPCGSYFFRIPEDPVLSSGSAAFILLHIAAILGDPTVIEARIFNN
ncbi:hypothetical protein [Geothrix campi]|uniref:hypothetical protein n=1 Tax=Geothrix campi TaxID=2966450 RepID=UPI0021480AE4|nr:hypothetical protein [Geothrix sp. SG10]